MVGGRGRPITRCLQAVPGLVAKDGAEGVWAGATEDGQAWAVKLDDGAERAGGPAFAGALRRSGIAIPRHLLVWALPGRDDDGARITAVDEESAASPPPGASTDIGR